MSSHTEKEIWVIGDLRNERFFGFGLNVLAKAREVAQPVSAKVVMVLIAISDIDESENDPVKQAFIPLAAAEQSGLDHGADKVCVLKVAGLSMPRADIYGHILSEAVLKHKPLLVLFALTDFGRELASRTAGLQNAGLLADCLDLRIENGEVIASSPSWGGEIMAELTFSDKHRTGFATLPSRVHRAVKAQGSPGVVERTQMECPDTGNGIKFLSSELEPAEHRKLEEAEVVVVGGAGLGSM
ncbi:MAG: XRE family transcriptional regulator, partial [Deltaproteobacteria bacterium]|nr:XRE family transcriptional regulator [Deltaproteobacteria bacterium]